MTKLKIAIFTYAYIKRANLRSTNDKKYFEFFLFRSRDQKYAEQKKTKKMNFLQDFSII